MGKVSQEISPDTAAWVATQMMFFVGTAPLSQDGHVNISPKGLDTLRILEPRRVAYLDLTGSGAETIAHVRENGRIVLMFCAFSGPPKIVRFHGNGTVVTPGTAAWAELSAQFPAYPGARAIIDVHVTRVSDSCGYGVPTFENPRQRETLQRWSEAKGAEGLLSYRRQKNAHSIDGLPGLVPEDGDVI